MACGGSLVIFVTSSDLRVSLGDERHLNTIVLGELDEGLLALADDENVGEAGGECVALGISQMDDLVGTGVLLNVHEGTDATNRVSSSDIDSGSVFEFDNSVDLTSLEVKL